MKKTVVLGVTSGIAAFRSVELVKLLRRDGLEVFVVMTPHATRMVEPLAFEKASEHKVYSELFEEGFDSKKVLSTRKVDHIELADKADVLVIAPATANIIAKLAHGLADDFLTTAVLATTAPIILCPSMNVHMWNNPIVGENIGVLRKRGYSIVEPESGMLACGYQGKGRLAHIETIKEEVMRWITYRSFFKGTNVLVTAGGTIEPIDDVRSITNRSSGKMGVAIAEECFVQGANVLLLRAMSSVQPRYVITERTFHTAQDLLTLLKTYIHRYDILYHTAAVSDFTPAKKIKGKVSSKEGFALLLKPQIKIIDEIKTLNPKIKLIAFKAEWGLSEDALVRRAFQKLKESRADIIVANDISKNDRGFEADTNEVFVVSLDGSRKKISLRSKREVAKELIDYLREQLHL